MLQEFFRGRLTMGEIRKGKRRRLPVEAFREAVAGQGRRRARDSTPELSEMMEHFFHLAGGQRAVASMLLEEWHANKPGSLARTRILETILRATRYANEQRPPQTDLGHLSEEDILAELGQIMADVDEADDAEPAIAGPDAAAPVPGAGEAAAPGAAPAEREAAGPPGPAAAGPAAAP